MDRFVSDTASSAFAQLSSDTITITRRENTGGRTFSVTTIYSGPGDLQESGGTAYYGPAGAVEVADATLVLSADTAAALPSVLVDDIVTRGSDSKTFTVTSTAIRGTLLPHLELRLKRGGLQMQQAKP